MDLLSLTVMTPERRLLDRVSVRSVTLPTSEGEVQVLPEHAAMIGTLYTGAFSYEMPDGIADVGVISTGFFEISGNSVQVFAETIELKSEIDLNRAKTAQEKAESALQGADLDEHQFKKYQLKLQRSLIRQQIAARSL